MISQITSFFGALLVLIAYFFQQFGHMQKESAPYLLLNILGAALLLYAAWLTNQPGFVLLQALWIGVTGYQAWQVVFGRKCS